MIAASLFFRIGTFAGDFHPVLIFPNICYFCSPNIWSVNPAFAGLGSPDYSGQNRLRRFEPAERGEVTREEWEAG